ncbi:MAG: hypothetical protein A2519_11395, partial [Candidatus Raymondbacteria bacterium RIFOXYD12_FULL_49_13]
MRQAPLVVSFRPHSHSKADVTTMYLNTILALMPAAAIGVSHYGLHALRVILLSMGSAMVFEIILQRLFRREITVHDGSAAFAGLLFALLLPPSTPFWVILVGAFMSMLVGKHVFGGLGCNPINSVLVGWTVVFLSWPQYVNFDFSLLNYDPGFSTLYPLSVLKKEGAAGIGQFAIKDLLLGNQAGGIGAASALCIVAGGTYLVLRGFASWIVPASFLIGIALCSQLFHSVDPARYAGPLFHILAGNALLGAFFLAPDYASSPGNPPGRFFYGLGAGVFAMLLRVWS